MQIKIQEEMSSKQKITKIQIISLVNYNINYKVMLVCHRHI